MDWNLWGYTAESTMAAPPPPKPDKKAYQADGITHEKSDQAVSKKARST